MVHHTTSAQHITYNGSPRDISTMLGGRPHDNQGKTREWPINRDVLNAVLDFAEAPQGSGQEKQKGPRSGVVNIKAEKDAPE